MWSVWLGLSAGLLEAGTRVLCRAIDPTKRLYLMSRHFVWSAPLANMLLFFGLGLLLAGITKLWPRLGARLSPRLLCALAMQPMLMLAAPAIYPAAWFVVALGTSSQLVPWLESQPAKRRLSLLFRTFPILLGSVLLLAGSVFGGDWLKQRRETSRALPPLVPLTFSSSCWIRSGVTALAFMDIGVRPLLTWSGWPNGIRFDRARATAPWTLPSHAGFFTGRWPHELDVHWLTPLRTGAPLLAEYMGSSGYATAGFVANTGYCSYDTGLARGFTYYEDYSLKKLAFLQTAVFVKEILRRIFELGYADESGLLDPVPELLKRWFYADARKDASSINRAFLDRLSCRPEETRPFFVFLNYMDAHAPYKLPDGASPLRSQAPKPI